MSCRRMLSKRIRRKPRDNYDSMSYVIVQRLLNAFSWVRIQAALALYICVVVQKLGQGLIMIS